MAGTRLRFGYCSNNLFVYQNSTLRTDSKIDSITGAHIYLMHLIADAQAD